MFVVEPADIEDVCFWWFSRRLRAKEFRCSSPGWDQSAHPGRGYPRHRGSVWFGCGGMKEESGCCSLCRKGASGMPTLIGLRHPPLSLAGSEWAAGIPGTVAGCVVMNAGTRLGEMKDSLKAVRW